jgi:hypothetical protein
MNLIYKCVVTVAATWMVRLLAIWAGPRIGGIVLGGLPCSTALMLFFLGKDQGPEFAGAAAHSGLLGLVGTMALALSYAWLAGRGQGCLRALGGALAVYFLPTLVFWGLNPTQFGVAMAWSVAGVLGAMAVAVFVPLATDVAVLRGRSQRRALFLRTVVPVVCVVLVTELATTLGTVGSGLLGTFPATFVTVVVITHLEDGPRAAGLLARSLPQGNLSMIAFLAVFRWTCPAYGLIRGFIVANVAAIVTMALVEAGRYVVARRRLSRIKAARTADYSLLR